MCSSNISEISHLLLLLIDRNGSSETFGPKVDLCDLEENDSQESQINCIGVNSRVIFLSKTLTLSGENQKMCKGDRGGWSLNYNETIHHDHYDKGKF